MVITSTTAHNSQKKTQHCRPLRLWHITITNTDGSAQF